MTEELEFEIVREDWSVYQLESGSIVRHRMAVVGFERDEKTKQPRPQFKSSYVFIPSKEDLGPPDDKFVPGQAKETDVVGKYRFRVLKEPINIYELPGESVLVLSKLFLTEIRKTEKFNRKGKRIVGASLRASVAIIPYPKPPEKQVGGSIRSEDKRVAAAKTPS